MFSFQIDDQLKLVLPVERNAEEIYGVVRENLDELKLWMPWADDDYSLDSAREYVRGNLSEFATTGSFSASILENEKIVGAIGFHHLDTTNKSAQLGYWLAKSAQSKGLMTRCSRVLIDYLFEEMELNRVQINCNALNTKSRRVAERLGFNIEGIRRQARFEHDRFTDWAVYALLREEWRKQVKSEK